MDPDKARESPEKRPSRLGSAWMALRGDPVIPASIRAEWAVCQIQLQNLCDQVTQAAARAYERDRVKLKAAADRIAELETRATSPKPSAGLSPGSESTWHPDKIALYRLARAKNGQVIPNADPILEHSNVTSD